jgi:hypothetical protein
MLHRREFVALSAGAAFGKAEPMDAIAERYVKLVLAVGVHDPDYVDAYYGPRAWQDEIRERKPGLKEIRTEAAGVAKALETQPGGTGERERLRHRYLSVQTNSLAARVDMLLGKRFSFDEESRALYDAVAPVVPVSHFESTLTKLEKLIPGEGPLAGRYKAWSARFEIPAGRLDEVFRAAIDGARARTKRHIRLPDSESFQVEYVNKQVWSAYNWYKGNAHSLIQVNTDLPVSMNAALRLACHEGYPGHHVYNTLLEDRLVRGRGWVEYSVYPLYSPQSLIAEGTADYGMDLVFPHAERAEFFAATLFPRAGLDGSEAAAYLQAARLAEDLDHAGNMAARRLINGEISREECQKLLERYALQSPERAGQRVRFIEKNRSYVINYNVGEDLVRAHMQKRGAAGSGPAAWKEFEALLSSPRLPSGLVA